MAEYGEEREERMGINFYAAPEFLSVTERDVFWKTGEYNRTGHKTSLPKFPLLS